MPLCCAASAAGAAVHGPTHVVVTFTCAVCVRQRRAATRVAVGEARFLALANDPRAIQRAGDRLSALRDRLANVRKRRDALRQSLEAGLKQTVRPRGAGAGRPRRPTLTPRVPFHKVDAAAQRSARRMRAVRAQRAAARRAATARQLERGACGRSRCVRARRQR
jgi:hypothetical protein